MAIVYEFPEIRSTALCVQKGVGCVVSDCNRSYHCLENDLRLFGADAHSGVTFLTPAKTGVEKATTRNCWQHALAR
jgi:hypothetical protein